MRNAALLPAVAGRAITGHAPGLTRARVCS